MREVTTTVFWLVLGVSALLTWYGINRAAPKSLYLAAALAAAAAIPTLWSIGPLILLVALLQLTGALMFRRGLFG